MGDVVCRNCGHPAGYHSTPICGYDHGARRPERCQCGQWEGVSYALTAVEQRLAAVTAERDAYMQTVLDLIHDIARPTEDTPGAPDE